MPLTGAAATALDNDVIRPAWFGFLDLNGDPVRATTWRESVAFSATGDSDLDGNTFLAIDHELVSVGDIHQGESGSHTMRISLSGLITEDTGLLNTIGNRTNWAGRVARIWLGVYDESGSALGAVAPYYTGYMTEIRLVASADEQRIVIDVENYLAAFSQASNRSYLDQAYYDSGDLSAQAAIDIANGVSGNPLTNNTPVGGGGGWRRIIDPVDVGKL